MRLGRGMSFAYSHLCIYLNLVIKYLYCSPRLVLRENFLHQVDTRIDNDWLKSEKNKC